VTASPTTIAILASWIATLAGLGMWLWSWLREGDAIRRLRLYDCGMVLVFSAILVRIVAQARPLVWTDWALLTVSPLFIAAALWRLARTGRAE
jgi:hypothetical protein